MKKYIILFLLCMSTSVFSQVGLSINPHLPVTGIIYASNAIPVYTRIRGGVTSISEPYIPYYKLSLGGQILIDGGKLLLGINRNITNARVYPYSIEFGFKAQPSKLHNFYLVVITDPFNWETDIGFIINFSKIHK
jgi:hypothetical protein